MDLRSFIRIIRKSWWILALGIACGVAAAGAVNILSPNIYASSSTFFVRTPTDQIGGAYQGDQFAQKRVNSYVQLAQSQRLADLILSETQLDLTSDQVSQRISAKGDINTVLLTVTVIDQNAQQSLDIARAASAGMVKLVGELETPPGSTDPSVSLEIVSQAALQPRPIAPRNAYNLAIGAIVGLILGALVIILRNVLDTTVRTTDVLKQISRSGSLATIPFDSTTKTSPLIVYSHSRSIRAEAFRQLRTNIQYVNVDAPSRVIVVSSSVPNEGKSSTSTNLAIAYAETETRVLLIDADLRRPTVADLLGLDGSVGLTNVLAGQVAVDEALQAWGRGGLTFLGCGVIPPNPSELLASKNMGQLLTRLKESFDIIIIDTPPLLAVTDAAVIATTADGAILVARYGKTGKAQFSAAVEALDAVGAKILGTVLNMVPPRDGSSNYSYGYEYVSETETSDTRSESDEGRHTRAELSASRSE